MQDEKLTFNELIQSFRISLAGWPAFVMIVLASLGISLPVAAIINAIIGA